MQMRTQLYVPPSLHETEIERHYEHEQQPDDDLRPLASAMAQARRGAEQLLQSVNEIEADRMLSPEGKAEELRKAARIAADKATGPLSSARQRAADVMKRLEAGAESAPPPPGDPVALQIEAEVRSRLAQMSAVDRRKTLSTALESGDDAVIGAVLRGPAMLTGMDPAEHDLLRQAWRQARHPARAARIDRLDRALTAADRGSNLLARFVEQVSSLNFERARV